MMMKFSYIQIGAEHPQNIAEFYRQVLNLKVSNQKEWLNHREGYVFELPGYAEGRAPVLGIVKAESGKALKVYENGFAHIGFETTHVRDYALRCVKYGGKIISQGETPENGSCIYCTDPEGNIVEFVVPILEPNGCLPRKTLFGKYITKYSAKHRIPKVFELTRFIHVNINCQNWEDLCGFYKSVLDTDYFGAYEDHHDALASAVTGVPNVHMNGRHIFLKGLADTFPTFEIYTYHSPKAENTVHGNDTCGINAIGFRTNNMEKAASTITDYGGVVKKKNEECLVASDPRGNVMFILSEYSGNQG